MLRVKHNDQSRSTQSNPLPTVRFCDINSTLLSDTATSSRNNRVTPLLKAVEADEDDTNSDSEDDSASWLDDAPAQFSSDDTFLVGADINLQEDRLLQLLSSDVAQHDEHDAGVRDRDDQDSSLNGMPTEDGEWGEWDFSVQ